MLSSNHSTVKLNRGLQYFQVRVGKGNDDDDDDLTFRPYISGKRKKQQFAILSLQKFQNTRLDCVVNEIKIKL